VADGDLRVLLADAHPVIRSGLRAVLETVPDLDVVGEADSAAATTRAVLMHRPAVVVLDLDLGERTLAEVLRSAPRTAVLVFTNLADDLSIISALRAGALGYVLKDAGLDSIVRAIRGVAAGETVLCQAVARRLRLLVGPAVPDSVPTAALTEREREVLKLVAIGLPNSAIARTLGLAPKTISNHLSAIFGKLRVSSRAEAAVLARRGGLY
jgi:DNA-binding NarL/FixJ family response regulator